MAGVGIRRRRWLPSQQKVNWANPLTDGLISLVPGNRNPLVDLVTGQTFTMQGSPEFKAGRFGVGIDDTADTKRGGYYQLTTDSPLRAQPPLTIACAGTQFVTPGNGAAYFGVRYDNADGFPYVCYILAADTTAPGYYRFAGNTGPGGFHSVAGSVITYSSGNMETQVGIRDGATIEIWVNGYLENTANVTFTNISYGATAELLFCSDPDVTRSSGSSLALGAIWNRRLTNQEIAEFHTDPMQLLRVH